jgi:hypothetical protein
MLTSPEPSLAMITLGDDDEVFTESLTSPDAERARTR